MESVDAIVVLGGGVSDKGVLPQTVKERVKRSVNLFWRHKAKYIIMSGAWSYKSNRKKITEAKAMKMYAVKLGVKKISILLEERSKDTIGNAYFTRKEILDPKRLRKIIIVTSRYHAKRSEYLFNKVLGSKFTVNISASESKIGPQKLRRRMKKEKEMLQILKKYLGKIPSGNMLILGKLLTSVHPAYSGNKGSSFISKIIVGKEQAGKIARHFSKDG